MIPLIIDETKIYTHDFDGEKPLPVIGVMNECIKCNVVEERNGMFEAEIKMLVSAKTFAFLKLDGILAMQTEKRGNLQLFRIYKITKDKKQMATINACHISYDLGGVVVRSFDCVRGAVNSALAVKNNMIGDHVEKWEFRSESINNGSKFGNHEPRSFRNLLGGSQNSYLSVFKGEYKFDNFKVIHMPHRGKNRGVSIRYGKNLIDLRQEENIEAVYSHVFPYAKRTVGNKEEVVEGGLRKVNDGRYKILTIDLTSKFEQDEEITVSAVNEKLLQYVDSHQIGVPKINIKVKFIDLTDTTEFADSKIIDEVKLCDEVNVIFDKLKVRATAKVVRTNYNVLKERYDEIELGNAKTTLSSTIAEIQESTEYKIAENKTFMEKAIDNATELIKNGGNNGHVVFGTDLKGNKQEIFVLDNADKKLAKQVLRINKNGIGFSKNGIDGSYDTAWTVDGTFNANFINSGTLSANHIRGGVISDMQGGTVWNLNTGVFESRAVGDQIDQVGRGLTQEIKKNSAKIETTATQIRSEVRSKTSAGEVRSLIDQRADSIRLKANNISWSSNFSSMTSDGKLTCREATIKGKLTSYTSYDTYASVDDASFNVVKNGKRTGYIGTNNIHGDRYATGLTFTLGQEGRYMGWYVDDGVMTTLKSVLTYDKNDKWLQAHETFEFRNTASFSASAKFNGSVYCYTHIHMNDYDIINPQFTINGSRGTSLNGTVYLPANTKFTSWFACTVKNGIICGQ